MKTKLLKKLRKKASKVYRLVYERGSQYPTNYPYKIEKKISTGWISVDNKKTKENGLLALQIYRRNYIISLLNENYPKIIK